jgi:hypothetical protein
MTKQIFGHWWRFIWVNIQCGPAWPLVAGKGYPALGGGLKHYNTEILTLANSVQSVWRAVLSLQVKDLFCRFRKSRRTVAAIENYVFRLYPALNTYPVAFKMRCPGCLMLSTFMYICLYCVTSHTLHTISQCQDFSIIVFQPSTESRVSLTCHQWSRWTALYVDT